MATEKLITLPLLEVFKTKMQEWTSAQDQTLKTELLETIGDIASFEIDVVEALPESGTKGHIYFVPKTATDEKNTSLFTPFFSIAFKVVSIPPTLVS